MPTVYEVWWMEMRGPGRRPLVQHRFARTEHEALLWRERVRRYVGCCLWTLRVAIHMQIGACDGGA